MNPTRGAEPDPAVRALRVRRSALGDVVHALPVTAAQARHPGAGLLLAAICLAVWLPGFATLPVVDRDESRFLLAARTMVESGDAWVPRLGDRPRLEKPPLATWLQAATVALTTGGDPRRDAPWMGRLPSLLCAFATVLVVWRGGARRVDPRAAWLAALLLGLSPTVVWETHQARADLVLLLPSTICLLALGRVWGAARRGRPAPAGAVVQFWVALLIGVLAKGPITPWIAAAAIAGIAAGEPPGQRTRWLRRLRPVLGIAALAAAIALLAGVQSRAVGGAALAATAYRETIGRVLAGVDGHFAPPGLHALLAPALLWPGSLGLLGGLVWCWRRSRSSGAGRSWPAGRFLLAWALPAWLGLELAATKLPHYTLPLHVPLLLVCSRWLLRLAARRPVVWPVWLRWPLELWKWLPAILLPAVAGLLVQLASGSSTWALVTALAVLAPLVQAARQTDRAPITALAWALGALALVAITVGFALPRWSAPWTAERLADAVVAADPQAERPLADAAWGESSLPLLTRRPVRRLAAEEVEPWLAEHPGGIVVVPRAEVGDRIVLARIEGIDPVHGRRVELALVTAQSAPNIASP